MEQRPMEALVTCRNKNRAINQRHLTQPPPSNSYNDDVHYEHSCNTSRDTPKNQHNKDPGSCPAKKKPGNRFPRDVFTASDYNHIASPLARQEIKLITRTNNAQPLVKAPSISHMTPVTSFKLAKHDLRTIIQVKTIAQKVAETEHPNIKPKLMKKLRKREKPNPSHLPQISSKPTGKDDITPRWKVSGGNLISSTIRFLSIEELLESQAGKYQSRHNSNQIANLELASLYSAKSRPPRVVLNLGPKIETPKQGSRATKIVRLKPIQRDAISSRGNTIKLQVSKTRPSSKEEEAVKQIPRFKPAPSLQEPVRVLNSTVKVKVIKEPDKPTKRTIVNPSRLQLLNSKVTTRRVFQISNSPSIESSAELCNVTFGEAQFKEACKRNVDSAN